MTRSIRILALASVALLPLMAHAATPAKSSEKVSMSDSKGKTNAEWWPTLLDLSPLRMNDPKSNPLGADFDYAKAYNALDIEAVKADIRTVLHTSQPWWPSDYGNYGPFFIRMAWHGAGTYRQADGRGGAGGAQQRFEPLNSWPDNVNLDKARRLVWPIKQKYGQSISWGDLMELTGNVALEDMGFKTIGFAGGRRDEWEADNTYWGPERKWLDDQRHLAPGEIAKPLAASQLGLIYVNPEGPHANADPIGGAKEIRATFGNMGMDDEETVALIAGGHTFGKSHGAHPKSCVGDAPTAMGVEKQGLGWENKCGTGVGADAVGAGPEGAWSSTPAKYSHEYLENLFGNEWVKTKSPSGAGQWKPKVATAGTVTPDAHIPGKTHQLMMFTTDISIKDDPSYRKIALNFKDHPEQFDDAFARAWFKLLHRDMGPRSHYLGKDVPAEQFIWQDPLPDAPKAVISAGDAVTLKNQILDTGLSGPALVRAAWASAASYRQTDMRGGTNGARVRLEPQVHWAANSPDELANTLAKLGQVQADFNAHHSTAVSLADVIVLGGNAAIEQAAAQGGVQVNVPFVAGRVDASQEQTDVKGFAAMEPTSDGFRNYYNKADRLSPTDALVERAYLLDLTVPEMTVLVGGLRSLNANAGGTSTGVLTAHPGVLSNDFFVNLLDMGTVWNKSGDGVYVGADRATGASRWTATPVDLIFGSNSELRAVSEVYASQDAKVKFISDFANAWGKVMNLDRAPM